jgi:hypothetical protein
MSGVASGQRSASSARAGGATRALSCREYEKKMSANAASPIAQAAHYGVTATRESPDADEARRTGLRRRRLRMDEAS